MVPPVETAPEFAATERPAPALERIGLLDALRGLALFGVLVVNMNWFATAASSIPREQFESLITAPIDRWVGFLVSTFVYAKANTIFTVLFGASFALQMSRLQQRTDHPRRFYVRRLLALLVIGLVHFIGFWKGEILHVYALTGFVLLAFWRVGTRTIVVIGLILIIVVYPVMAQWDTVFGPMLLPSFIERNPDPVNTPEALAAREAAFVSGSYREALCEQWRYVWKSRYLQFGVLVWCVYALGRFLLGAALLRSGYLTRPEQHRRKLVWAAVLGLPLGLFCFQSWMVVQRFELHGLVASAQAWRPITGMAEQIGSVLMALAYMALIALAWQARLSGRVLRWFVPHGQMALTNYLLQTVFNSIVFFGYSFALVGRIGATGCLVLSLAFFALQTWASKLWIDRYRFGPAEWGWRWWTYGARPPLRR
jgi:uncharacterized protein